MQLIHHFYGCSSVGAFLPHPHPRTRREKALRHARNLECLRAFVQSCVRELPCFSAQKNVRLSRDLSAKRNALFKKPLPAAGLLDRNVTFIFHFDENVTVALWKTKALILIADSTSRE